MRIQVPRDLPDCRDPHEIAECRARADQYAAPGSVMHFALCLGFMPHDERAAEAIFERIVRELEWLEGYLDIHGQEVTR